MGHNFNTEKKNTHEYSSSFNNWKNKTKQNLNKLYAKLWKDFSLKFFEPRININFFQNSGLYITGIDKYKEKPCLRQSNSLHNESPNVRWQKQEKADHARTVLLLSKIIYEPSGRHLFLVSLALSG